MPSNLNGQINVNSAPASSTDNPGKYNISYKALNDSQHWWTRKSFDEKCITRIVVANFCGFIMYQCIHPNSKYFCHTSELATKDKYEQIGGTN